MVRSGSRFIITNNLVILNPDSAVELKIPENIPLEAPLSDVCSEV